MRCAQGRYTEEKQILPHDLPDHTVALICSAYLVDYCCFGFQLPPACVAAGLSCDGDGGDGGDGIRDDYDMLRVHWKGAAHSQGQKAHVYNSEATFLKKLKTMWGQPKK